MVAGETVAAVRHTTPDAAAVLEAQIAGRSKSVICSAGNSMTHAREDRDRWRAQAESAQRQLTGQGHRSWWQRMVGE